MLQFSATARPREIDEKVHELLAYLARADLVVYGRSRLDDLLNRPNVAPISGDARGRVRDLLPAALIILPSPAQVRQGSSPVEGAERGRAEAVFPSAPVDYDLPSLAESLGLQPYAEQDPLGRARLCQELEAELQARLSALPGPLLLVVRQLIGGDPAFDWLPWDELALPRSAAGALEMLAAGMPKAPPQRSRKRLDLEQPLDELTVSFFQPEGPIAREFERYEHRPGQIEMAEGVARSLEDEQFLLVEAGTGVGKSLAYLVPAILWARANAEPVLVSTNTKNLQEQLVGQDLPLLARALPVDFEAALVKGRNNYLCVRRLLSLLREARGSLFPEERASAAYLASWAATSENGDLDALPPEADEAFESLRGMIDRVRSDRTTCVGPSCAYRKVCSVRVARALGRNADLVVSNHALTLADSESDALPRYSRVIFDEAHNLEAVATDQLGSEVSTFSFAGLRRTFGGEGRHRGFLDSLFEQLNALDEAEGAPCRELAESLASDVRMTLECAEELGESVTSFCRALDPRARRARASVRLGALVRQAPEWAPVAEKSQQCGVLLARCHKTLAELAEKLTEMGEDRPPLEELALEAAGARATVAELSADLGAVLEEEDAEAPRHVCWAEISQAEWGAWWRLCAAPIRVGPVLEEAVYSRNSALVLTSATLTVDGEFDYLRHRLGLNEHAEEIVEQSVPSPFALEQQLLLCVPNDLPIAGEAGSSEAIIEAILGIASLTSGGMLVLFTARDRMTRTYEETRDRLADLGMNPLCQQVSGPRWFLLDQLRQRDNTVLYGLKSFWEGVDVPGRSLRCVVITKLPFAVPSDPIIEARCEQVEREGLSSGQHYYIPEAVIAFKQGFGRLIRATTDRGVVFVLDKRLIMRGYGRRFFASLQRCSYATGSLDECIEEAEIWLRRV